MDGAESKREVAHAVNATGAGNLARAAAQIGTPLLHISTDYVFDGAAPRDAAGHERPYVESDPTGPRSVYGETKLAGEREVLAASAAHTVVRTAWLYGVDGKNFVDTMLRLAGEREAVQVVTDQVGSPTWSGHLAPAILGLLEREVRGLVHLTGAGAVSWNGFAKEIFRQAEVDCRVEPASSEQMARPAPRPGLLGARVRARRRAADAAVAGRAGGVSRGRAGVTRVMRGRRRRCRRELRGRAARGRDDAAMKLLVCGGAGFIGSTFVRLRVKEQGDEVTVLDKLTYAGREENLQRGRGGSGLSLHPRRDRGSRGGRGRDRGRAQPDAIVNFAAETHVDRSIAEPDAFVKTHALGTHVLLEAARAAGLRYLQVSTDEVYGSIEEGSFTEESPAAAVLAVLGDEDGRGPARAELLPHLRAARGDLPRLEQLRARTSTRRS